MIPRAGHMPPNFTFVPGDARAFLFRRSSFDIVFSNSVIEHVGTYDDQKALRKRSATGGTAALGADPEPIVSDRAALYRPSCPWIPRKLQREYFVGFRFAAGCAAGITTISTRFSIKCDSSIVTR